MSLSEDFNFVAELVRQGPAVVASVVFGGLGGVWMGWKIWGHHREEFERLRRETSEARSDLRLREERMEKLRDESKLLHERYVKVESEGQQAKAKEAEAREQRKQYEIAWQRLRAEKQQLEGRLSKITPEVADAAAAESRLRSELTKKTEEVQAAEQTRREKEVENQQLLDQLAKAARNLSALDHEKKSLLQDRQQAQDQILPLQREVTARRERLDQVSRALAASQAEVQQWREAAEAAERRCEEVLTASQDADERCKQVEVHRAALEQQLVPLAAQARCLTDLRERVISSRGSVWKTPLAPGTVAFRPLAERRMPIISVVNLKGGVGKTTITGNLGVTLGKQDLRVLLVDLDYQSSLSAMCLAEAEMPRLFKSKKTVYHLLEQPNPTGSNLLECIAPVPETGCNVVVASDELADVEQGRMLSWLLEPDGKDLRTVLRGALHSPDISERFDCVLLDCPPRLTTACVNALAASDYVLIPVLLDSALSPAVPRLLKQLRDLKSACFPELALLGILANRTAVRTGFARREEGIWEDFKGLAPKVWKAPVYLFKTVIQQTARFTTAANANRWAAFDSELESMFVDLAREIRRRVPRESFRAAGVS